MSNKKDALPKLSTKKKGGGGKRKEMAPLFNETYLRGQEEKEEVKIREAREYDAHGSMAKILCEVSWGGAQLSLLYLPSEEQREPFPFKPF
jgi:hypothetical protein